VENGNAKYSALVAEVVAAERRRCQAFADDDTATMDELVGEEPRSSLQVDPTLRELATDRSSSDPTGLNIISENADADAPKRRSVISGRLMVSDRRHQSPEPLRHRPLLDSPANSDNAIQTSKLDRADSRLFCLASNTPSVGSIVSLNTRIGARRR
jgi:hypothetical protein